MPIRFFLILLFFVSISALTDAQIRYTVNRSVSTPTPIPIQVSPPVKEEVAEYTSIHSVPIGWKIDYEDAIETARISSRNLLIYLYVEKDVVIPDELAALPIVSGCRQFDTVVLDNAFVRSGLCRYVLLKLPMNAQIFDNSGIKTPIYALPGFEHMTGHPGLVVIDFANRDASHYGDVVGILPFFQGICPTADQTEIFLKLPPGTLTQRTLTYAVRVHHDQPLSADGEPAPIVVQMATEHALYQAERGYLTHVNFGVRSYRAKEVLGGGSPAEICAQSQSGVGLFEGAIGCMRAWRYSSAHWSIARKSQTYYGYDMVLGNNGAWYAVGFFIN